MKNWLALTSFILMLWGPWSALAANWEDGLSVQQITQAQKGDVVVCIRGTTKASLKSIDAIGYVNAPIDEVWRIITDYNHYSKIYSGVIKSELRGTEGSTSHIYMLLDYPWPLPDKWVLCDAIHSPESWAIGIQRREGTIKTVDGGWRLYPNGNRTLVIYSILFDPGLGFFPPWLLEWGTTQAAPVIITGLRNYLKSSHP